ncbi:hypothetical protein PRZ48_000811 [Zasmidium cellare]|uniref:Uncharacterized protein n=1 Tax=Zasmidium cellare TaxID=395010 RepID=A0ABR0EZU1_ZASCE|nr:hypothetical protein PRZ48_000811 [Zasmidium cellare]
MPGYTGSSSSSPDARAINYLQSLTVDEVRAMVELMDLDVGIGVPSWVTDEDMEKYRNNMIRDIRSGPLRGQGSGIVASFPKSLLRAHNARRGPSRAPASGRVQRPANGSSLDYSRLDDVDTESEHEPDSDSDFSPDPDYVAHHNPAPGMEPFDNGFTAQESFDEPIEFLQTASLADIRRLLAMEERSSPRDRSDAEVERVRSEMMESLTMDSNDNQMRNNVLDGTSDSKRPWTDVERQTTNTARQTTNTAKAAAAAKGNIFMEKDDELFRRTMRHRRHAFPTKTRFATAEEVRAQARASSEAIFDHYENLKGYVERHEATIGERWAKKTKTQRSKVLLEAWPGMSREHRPDLDAADRTARDFSDVFDSEKYRDAYMWPHVNREDLSQPRILSLFIRSRGRNPPWAFLNSDIESVKIGQAIGGIDELYLNRHSICFRDRFTSETYGELVEIHTDEQWVNLIADGALPPHTGLTVLAIQERILSFLVHCCQLILHDIPPNELLDYPIQPEPTKDDSASTATSVSLANVVLEAPYRVPDGIDISRLKALFSAKRAAAQDHIWTLREDPSYFLDTLKEAMDHRYEQVRDAMGHLHPHFKPGKETLLWAPVVSNVVASAEWHLETWTRLCDIITRVEEELNKHNDPSSSRLPPPLKLELSYLKVFLKHAMVGPQAQLKAAFYSSPNMRQHMQRNQEDTPLLRKSGICEMKLWPSITNFEVFFGENSPEQRLLWLVKCLTAETHGNKVAAERWGLSTVLDELGRLIENKPRAKKLVSSHVASIISDMSVLAEATRQMIGYSGQLYEVPMERLSDSEGNDTFGIIIPWSNIIEEIEGSNPHEFYKLCIPPVDGRFHYPSEKRRSKKNHDAMRAAERNLDAFWHKVDTNLEIKRQWRLAHLKECDQCCGCGIQSAMRDLLAQPRYLHRLGPWVEPEKQQKEDTAAQQPLSEVYFDLEHRTERTVAKSHDHKHGHSYDHAHHHGRTKAKTRGTPHVLEEEATSAAQLAPSDQQDEHPSFALDARALKVFKTIFFNPAVSSTPGDVPWLDFVYAMTATGFQAEKLYGSVWQFKPKKLDVERSIQFHEPHPSGKIPYRTCRNHGRRLNRAYGWTGENFVLASKDAGKVQG